MPTSYQLSAISYQPSDKYKPTLAPIFMSSEMDDTTLDKCGNHCGKLIADS